MRYFFCHQNKPITVALLALLWLYLPPAWVAAAQPQPETTAATAKQGTPNRLINSGSPYLLQHAYNPVDWYPWGREALERAKRENKPIFLSVGYSTCYWCHVANETLYANPDIAALMNRWFINIKVDREQRPDIDRIYIQATLLMTQRAGWPNNLFLTPELKPFFAGTYFPPADDEFGRPGFTTILKQLHNAWETQRTDVIASAEQIHVRLQEAAKRRTANAKQPVDVARWRQTAATELRDESDPEHGGQRTQSGSKFPLGPVLELLIAESRMPQASKAVRAQLTKTLDAIAFGGIHDQVDGGFHRYTVEPSWSIPHFEKMLYDNAQLLRIYAQAYEITGSTAYKAVAERTAEWLQRSLGAPDGGFFTALDASVAGEEGRSYVWRRAEIEALLGQQEARRYFDAFELKPIEQRGVEATFEEPGVLRLRLPIIQTLKRSKQPDVARLFSSYAPLQAKLLAARNTRQQPARDEKMLVGLNGLAIEAYAISSRIPGLGKPVYLETARRAAERMWSLAYDTSSGRLSHEIYRGRAQTDGFLEDYALLGRGLMALHIATREPIWRQRAALLADAILRDFQRSDGSVAATRDPTDLLVSADDTDDLSYPSGTSATLGLLLQLAACDQKNQYAKAAQALLAAMSASLHEAPQEWPSMLAILAQSPTVAPTVSSAKPKKNEPTANDDLPGTAEKLSIASRIKRGKAFDEVTVTLTVKPGWHINANPASFAYLIPTSVIFDGIKPQSVRYPEAIQFKARFTPTVIEVYEGKVNIVAGFAKGVLPKNAALRATLSTQACDDTVCLPPAKIKFIVPPL